jgi:hypothetical protein
LTIDRFEWTGGTQKGNGNPETSYTTLNAPLVSSFFQGNLSLNGRSIRNYDTLEWKTDVAAGSTLTTSNNGLIFNTNTTIFTSGDGTATLAGTGTIFNYGGTLAAAGDSTFTINTTASIAGGQIYSDSALVFSGATVFTDTTEADGTGFMSFSGTVSVQDTLEINGALVITTFGATSFGISGIVSLNSGDLTLGETSIAGSLLAKVGSNVMQGLDLTLTSTGIAVNEGTWTITGGNVSIGQSARLENRAIMRMMNNIDTLVSGLGEFDNDLGLLSLREGTLTIDSAWAQAGTIEFQGGHLQVNGSFTNNGEITIKQDATIFADIVTNHGSISFSLAALGAQRTLSISKRAGQSAGGNFAQSATGTLSMSLTDEDDPLMCDRLNVDGTATLDGTLNVGLVFGLVPKNDYWNLIAASSVYSAFATTNLPLGYNAVYTSASLLLFST